MRFVPDTFKICPMCSTPGAGIGIPLYPVSFPDLRIDGMWFCKHCEGVFLEEDIRPTSDYDWKTEPY